MAGQTVFFLSLVMGLIGECGWHTRSIATILVVCTLGILIRFSNTLPRHIGDILDSMKKQYQQHVFYVMNGVDNEGGYVKGMYTTNLLAEKAAERLVESYTSHEPNRKWNKCKNGVWRRGHDFVRVDEAEVHESIE